MAGSLGQGLSDAFIPAGAKGVIITAQKIETLKESEVSIKSANPNVKMLPLALEMTDDLSAKAALDVAKAHFGLHDDDMANFVRSLDSCLS
jgi:hypothetical protein